MPKKIMEKKVSESEFDMIVLTYIKKESHNLMGSEIMVNSVCFALGNSNTNDFKIEATGLETKESIDRLIKGNKIIVVSSCDCGEIYIKPV